MPIQPSHHVSTKFTRVYPGESGICRPYYAKRPQLPLGPRPKCAKRTQFQPVSSSPHWPKASPDAHRGTQFTPTATRLHAKYAKRTQSQPSPRSNPPIMRNEPNFCPRVVIPSVGLRSGPKSRDPLNHHRRRRFRTNKPYPYPKNTKRTQFQTNNIHSTIYNIQSHGPIRAKSAISSCDIST